MEDRANINIILILNGKEIKNFHSFTESPNFHPNLTFSEMLHVLDLGGFPTYHSSHYTVELPCHDTPLNKFGGWIRLSFPLWDEFEDKYVNVYKDKTKVYDDSFMDTLMSDILTVCQRPLLKQHSTSLLYHMIFPFISSESPAPICCLCLSQKNLLKSHFVPRSVLARTSSDPKAPTFYMKKEKPKTAKHATLPLFCSACEALMSEGGENAYAVELDKFLEDFRKSSSNLMFKSSKVYHCVASIVFRVLLTDVCDFKVCTNFDFSIGWKLFFGTRDFLLNNQLSFNIFVYFHQLDMKSTEPLESEMQNAPSQYLMSALEWEAQLEGRRILIEEEVGVVWYKGIYFFLTNKDLKLPTLPTSDETFSVSKEILSYNPPSFFSEFKKIIFGQHAKSSAEYLYKQGRINQGCEEIWNNLLNTPYIGFVDLLPDRIQILKEKPPKIFFEPNKEFELVFDQGFEGSPVGTCQLSEMHLWVLKKKEKQGSRYVGVFFFLYPDFQGISFSCNISKNNTNNLMCELDTGLFPSYFNDFWQYVTTRYPQEHENLLQIIPPSQ